MEKTGNLPEIASGASEASAIPLEEQQKDAQTDGTDAMDTTFRTFPNISQKSVDGKPTIIERVENYVKEHKDVGTFKAAEDLNLNLEDFLKIAASSPKLVFDSVDRRTVRWRQYFENNSDDSEEEGE